MGFDRGGLLERDCERPSEIILDRPFLRVWLDRRGAERDRAEWIADVDGGRSRRFRKVRSSTEVELHTTTPLACSGALVTILGVALATDRSRRSVRRHQLTVSFS